MGILQNMFDFRSKEEREEDYEDYVNWAFPCGKLQEDVVRALVAEVCPGVEKTLSMNTYLTTRTKLFGFGRRPTLYTEEEILAAADRFEKKCQPMLLYLVQADKRAEENGIYTAQNAQQTAEGIVMQYYEEACTAHTAAKE